MNAYLEYDSEVFKGKTVLLPCDDPEWSNFSKYFAQNFDKLGLKKSPVFCSSGRGRLFSRSARATATMSPVVLLAEFEMRANGGGYIVESVFR
jgi:hypothetical protein